MHQHQNLSTALTSYGLMFNWFSPKEGRSEQGVNGWVTATKRCAYCSHPQLVTSNRWFNYHRPNTTLTKILREWKWSDHKNWFIPMNGKDRTPILDKRASLAVVYAQRACNVLWQVINFTLFTAAAAIHVLWRIRARYSALQKLAHSPQQEFYTKQITTNPFDR